MTATALDLAKGPRRSTRIESIQILRGIAATLVVVDHALHGLIDVNVQYAYLSETASQLGRIGVLVFFVISGYIMVATSYRVEGPRIRVSAFFIHRLKRILPLYWILSVVAASLLVRKEGSATATIKLIKSMLFIPLMSSDGLKMSPVIGQGWTLYYEMTFYVVFGFCLALPRLWGIAICSAVFIVAAVGNMALHAFAMATQINSIVLFYTHYLVLLFVAGMMIGLVEKRVTIGRLIPAPAAISAGLMAFGIAHFWMFDRVSGLTPWAEALYFCLAAAVVTVCVFGQRIRYRGAMRVLVRSGDWSYATYLSHNFVIGTYAHLWGHKVGGALIVPYVLGIVIIASVIGWGVFTLLERNSIRLINAVLRFPIAVRAVHIG